MMLLEQNLVFFLLSISGLQASTNAWLSYLAYQSYEDNMNFPKGFAQKFKIFVQNIKFSRLWNYQNTSKKKLLHSLMNELKNSYINFWKDKIHNDSKCRPNGNKLRT